MQSNRTECQLTGWGCMRAGISLVALACLTIAGILFVALFGRWESEPRKPLSPQS